MIRYIIKNRINDWGSPNHLSKCVTKCTTKTVGDVLGSRKGRGFPDGVYSIKRIMVNGRIVKHTKSKKKAAINLFKLRMFLKRCGD